MNNSGRHQPEQEDFDRARRLMHGFSDGSSPKIKDDALIYYLDIYKKNTSFRIETSPSDAIWKSISAKIETENNSKNTNRLNYPPVLWKIAAIFLAVACLTLAYIMLQPADPVLVAESGAQQNITELADGSIVTLRPNSSLYELEETGNRQTYRIEGEAYFDVVENRNRLFTAISGDAKVVVTGTEFSLSNWSSAVRVYLVSGSVRFSDLDETQSVDLQPGEFSENIGDRLTDPVAIPGQTYSGWLTNELRLNSRTVADVAAEIEHHFNITLEIPDPIADEHLTGTLQLQNLEQLLSELALSLNGRFVKTDESLFEFEPLP